MPPRVLLLVCLPLAGVAATAAAQQRVDRGWPLAGDHVRISVPVARGTITIAGWDRDSVAVTGTLTAGAGAFAGSGDGRVVKLGVESPSDGAPAGGAELEVRVPHRARVSVKGAGATIAVTGIDGWLDLAAATGDIRINGSPEDVRAETLSGAIEILGGTVRTRVKTVSGPITLRGAGVDVAAATLSGAILVRAAGYQRGAAGIARGRFESVSGDVRFEGVLGRGAVIEVETQSGRIETRLSADVSAEIDVLSIGGTIDNRLTVGQATPRPGKQGYALRFTAGTGDAAVTIRSFKGAVVLAPYVPGNPGKASR